MPGVNIVCHVPATKLVKVCDGIGVDESANTELHREAAMRMPTQHIQLPPELPAFKDWTLCTRLTWSPFYCVCMRGHGCHTYTGLSTSDRARFASPR